MGNYDSTGTVDAADPAKVFALLRGAQEEPERRPARVDTGANLRVDSGEVETPMDDGEATDGAVLPFAGRVAAVRAESAPGSR